MLEPQNQGNDKDGTSEENMKEKQGKKTDLPHEMKSEFPAFLHETTSDLKAEKKAKGHVLMLENQDVLHEMTSEYKKHLHETTSDYTVSSLEKHRRFRG